VEGGKVNRGHVGRPTVALRLPPRYTYSYFNVFFIMSKKRVNFGSVATSEAARRELMKPVTAWERAWVTPDGSKVRVRQWVQTHKAPVSAWS
jgi:hypothetical protein